MLAQGLPLLFLVDLSCIITAVYSHPWRTQLALTKWTEGEQLGHAGPAFTASPFTMLEKVAECRDTKTLSCSSRLQTPGSMSQDRMPGGVGGRGR